MSKKAHILALAMNALQGKLTAVPKGLVEDVLNAFPDMGGIKLAEPAGEITKKALRYCKDGGRISHIIVNRVCGDVHISLLIDTPEYPLKSIQDLVEKPVLAYVYNNDYPYDNELGDIFLEYRSDRNIHRIG